MVKVKRKGKEWKPVGIHLENADELVYFEKLTDYEIIRGEINDSSHSNQVEESNKKRKRKKKPSNKQKSSESIDKKRTDKVSPAKKKAKMSVDSDEPVSVVAAVTECEPDIEKVDSWKQFNLPEPILKALAAKNFERPTEIQVI